MSNLLYIPYIPLMSYSDDTHSDRLEYNFKRDCEEMEKIYSTNKDISGIFYGGDYIKDKL